MESLIGPVPHVKVWSPQRHHRGKMGPQAHKLRHSKLQPGLSQPLCDNCNNTQTSKLVNLMPTHLSVFDSELKAHGNLRSISDLPIFSLSVEGSLKILNSIITEWAIRDMGPLYLSTCNFVFVLFFNSLYLSCLLHLNLEWPTCLVPNWILGPWFVHWLLRGQNNNVGWKRYKIKYYINGNCK